MTTLHFQTQINAPIEAVFDASRDIGLHIKTASQTNETAIAGTTRGLISLGETVTWRGNHFGLYLKHTSKIIEFDFPKSFTDEMIQGQFKNFKHKHRFKNKNKITEMVDILKYETPFGVFGKLFDRLFLKRHMKKFVKTRNEALKVYLEV